MNYALPDAFRISFANIDEEHDHIVEIVNRLGDICERGTPSEFEDEFKEFLVSLDRHFANEEKYMRDLGYPGLDWHVTHHAESADKARRIFQRCMRDGSIDDAVVRTLFSEIVHDVARADLKFREFLEGKDLI